MALISPSEIAKQKVLSVQEYTQLALQSIGNLFRKPLYIADMVQQADLIGVGSLPIVVLIGFFAGRNSSGMASELGSMIVTEQIDAMRALGTDPMKKLVTPRVVSTVFMLFFLTILSDLVGLAGGLMVSKILLKLDARQYWNNAWQSLVFQDVFMGLVKPLLFGFIVATVGCYYGMTARGGTQGVGRATTQAVVTASVLIVVVNFFVTQFLMNVLKYK